jgi:methyltransferase-like protein
MAFKALNSVRKKPIIIKCENLKTNKQVTKRKREKLMRVNNTLGSFEWTIINFASKFKLQVEGLDPHKNLVFSPHMRRWFMYLAKDSKMARRCEQTSI